MSTEVYRVNWRGIDGGREGLWREPLWTGVLQIIKSHCGEMIYDPDSEIYLELESKFPDEKWRSWTADHKFRPLFRDYPHPWKKTQIVSFSKQVFNITPKGQELLDGKVTKSEVLTDVFQSYSEVVNGNSQEYPFRIIASAFLEAPRPISTTEIYWIVMKNYRPQKQQISQLLRKYLDNRWPTPEATPLRRLRNMLVLMRISGLISSSLRRENTFWRTLDEVSLRNVLGVIR